MKNVKQEFTVHEVLWVHNKKDKDGEFAYGLTDSNKSGVILFCDKLNFGIGQKVKLVKTLVPSDQTVSGWIVAHSFLDIWTKGE